MTQMNMMNAGNDKYSKIKQGKSYLIITISVISVLFLTAE